MHTQHFGDRLVILGRPGRFVPSLWWWFRHGWQLVQGIKACCSGRHYALELSQDGVRSFSKAEIDADSDEGRSARLAPHYTALADQLIAAFGDMEIEHTSELLTPSHN
jgi:hypothetical protein